MNPQPLPARTSGDADPWDQAVYAFLVEKGSRSGSRRTVRIRGSDNQLIAGTMVELSQSVTGRYTLTG